MQTNLFQKIAGYSIRLDNMEMIFVVNKDEDNMARKNFD